MSHVIEVAASYRLLTETNASLSIESDQRPGVFLSMIHERYGQPPNCYDFVGHDQRRLKIMTGESLTMIARYQGRVIGCLVNEVDACEQSRLLLLPRGGYNLIVYQSRLTDDQEQWTQTLQQQALPCARTCVTAALERLLAACKQHYQQRNQSFPEVVRLLLPALEEAIEANDDQVSRENLVYLLTVLATEEIRSAPEILPAYEAASQFLS